MNEFKAVSDENLVKMVKNGDDVAFVELTKRYMKLIRYKSSTFHGRTVEPADFWQEGLIGLYLAARSFQPEKSASFKTFANVCISNRMVSAYRNLMSEGNKALNESISYEDEEFISEQELAAEQIESNPVMHLIVKEGVESINSFLEETLSDYEKKVLPLYLSGYSYSEIAEELNVSVKGVDNAIQRIRRKLKMR